MKPGVMAPLIERGPVWNAAVADGHFEEVEPAVYESPSTPDGMRVQIAHYRSTHPDRVQYTTPITKIVAPYLGRNTVLFHSAPLRVEEIRRLVAHHFGEAEAEKAIESLAAIPVRRKGRFRPGGTEQHGPPTKLARGQEILGPHARITQEAQEYHANHRDHFGLDLPLDGPGPVFDPDLSRRTAEAFDKAKHRPNNPKVKAAYDALKREVKAQYDFLRAKGVRFTPWTKEGQPYANSREMAHDARENRHLHYFPTAAGFGGPEGTPDHPLMEEVPGMPGVVYNDLFRVVHDYFGHAMKGHQFGPRGELQAWAEHTRMFSPLARLALTAETHGQNSWVNFGPHSHLSVTERPYAEQKATILPKNVTPPMQLARVTHDESQPDPKFNFWNHPDYHAFAQAGMDHGPAERGSDYTHHQVFADWLEEHGNPLAPVFRRTPAWLQHPDAKIQQRESRYVIRNLTDKRNSNVHLSVSRVHPHGDESKTPYFTVRFSHFGYPGYPQRNEHFSVNAMAPVTKQELFRILQAYKAFPLSEHQDGEYSQPGELGRMIRGRRFIDPPMQLARAKKPDSLEPWVSGSIRDHAAGVPDQWSDVAHASLSDHLQEIGDPLHAVVRRTPAFARWWKENIYRNIEAPYPGYGHIGYIKSHMGQGRDNLPVRIYIHHQSTWAGGTKFHRLVIHLNDVRNVRTIARFDAPVTKGELAAILKYHKPARAKGIDRFSTEAYGRTRVRDALRSQAIKEDHPVIEADPAKMARQDTPAESHLIHPEFLRRVMAGNHDGAKKFLQDVGDPLHELIDPRHQFPADGLLPQHAPDTLAAYGIRTNRSASIHLRPDGRTELYLRVFTPEGAKTVGFRHRLSLDTIKTLVDLHRRGKTDRPVQLARRRPDKNFLAMHRSLIDTGHRPDVYAAISDYLQEQGDPLWVVYRRAHAYRNSRYWKESWGHPIPEWNISSAAITRSNPLIEVMNRRHPEHSQNYPTVGITHHGYVEAPVTHKELQAIIKYHANTNIQQHHAFDYERMQAAIGQHEMAENDPVQLARPAITVARDTPNRFEAHFDTQHGRYRVVAGRQMHQKEGPWQLYFGRVIGEGNLDFGMTHDTGTEAVPIMRSVTDAVRHFLHSQKPKQIKFSAETGEASRVRLYERFASLLEKHYGYKVHKQGDQALTFFTLTRDENPST